MEYVTGLPLTAHCDAGRLDVRERLELFAQVCDALQHAHQNGIIHRDLKPSNILVATPAKDPAGTGPPTPAQVKIIDFGLAKPLSDHGLSAVSISITAGQLLGTLEYMSPEQADPTLGPVDTRADLYAMGVILYELLTGCLPFDSPYLQNELETKGITRIIHIIRDEDPPRPGTKLGKLGPAAAQKAADRKTDLKRLQKTLRGELGWIVAKAMDKHPDVRYASASELGNEVRRYLAGEPLVATRPPSALYFARKYLRKHRRAVAAIGVVAAFLIAGYVVRQHAEFTARQRRSREFLATAREELAGYRGSLEKAKGLEVELGALRDDVERSWRPVWERAGELALAAELHQTKTNALSDMQAANANAIRALNEAPPDAPEREDVARFFESFYWENYEATRREGPQILGPEFFREQVERAGGGGRLELDELCVFTFTTKPAGAAVYCFRYELLEGRLYPFPFHPQTGVSRTSHLIVERVWDQGICSHELAAGDELVQVNGKPVSTMTELAGALKDVEPDAAVTAVRRRADRTEEFIWTPIRTGSIWEQKLWPDDKTRRSLQDPYVQLGVTFEAYPLACAVGNRVGETRAEGPLDIKLPLGSYLLVFRKDGYPDVRYPLALPRPLGLAGLQTIRLLPAAAVPEGFIYIPRGIAATGGDFDAFQSLPWNEQFVPAREAAGFLIARHEVSTDEWLQFVNDPAVRERTDDKRGVATAVAPAVLEELRDRKSKTVQVIPGEGSRLYWESEGGGPWKPGASYPDGQWPVLNVSHLAALEYIHWRNERAVDAGQPWRLRLPTDLEWERAARGVDRRIYVWGDYMVWSFCSSRRGTIPQVRPQPVGTFPFDESVFGVRDMAGSALEHTADHTVPGLKYRSYRGGSFTTEDDYYFRLATRNGVFPTSVYFQSGLRLAADVPEAAANTEKD